MNTLGAPGPGPGRKELKIVVVGDGGCGKTSLLMVYSQGSFPEVRPAGGMKGVRLGWGTDLGPLGARDGPTPATAAWTSAPRHPAPRGSRHPREPPGEFPSPAECGG